MAKKTVTKAAPPKVKKEGRAAYIAKAPVRRLMKNEGAVLVAESCVELLIEELTKAAENVTREAVKLVKADKRKRVTAADIKVFE